MKYTVHLRSCGNPDHRQYGPISNPETVQTDTIAEAVQACRRYIEEWDLGGGNWPKTIIKYKGKRVAEVSYNGRLWDTNGLEIPQPGLETVAEIMRKGTWK